MAKMIPIKPIKTGSNGEVKVFNMFKDKLSDEWIVIHSYNINNDTDENEIDFVLIHRDIGVLAVEVKGGGVHLKDREWYTIDRNNKKEKIQDPYRQVGNNKTKLYYELEKLKDDKIINTSYVVIFPDVNRVNLETTLDDNRIEKTLFKDDMNTINLEEKLKEIANKQINKYPSDDDRRLGEETFKNLEDYFNPIFSTKYSERDLYIETNEHLLRLTKEQKNTAIGLLNNKRVSINGLAGTGKTVVGVYRAILGLDNNEKILYICHSIYSKEEIIKYTEKNKNKNNIDICSFREFETGEFSRTKNIGKWDCIIIDDARELTKEDIMSIKALKSEYIYILYDQNQTTSLEFDKDLDYLELDCKYFLNKNKRNTNQITKFAYELINKDYKDYQNGIDGQNPKIIFIKNNRNLLNQLRKYLKIMDSNNIFNYGEILILTNEKIVNSDIYCGRELYLSDELEPEPPMEYATGTDDRCVNEYGEYIYTTCNSCSSFYTRTIYQSIGLEKPYVILVDEKNCIKNDILKNDIPESKLVKNMLYIAISRAKYKATMILNYENDEKCKNLSDILGIEYEVYDTFEHYIDKVKIKKQI